ncbi:MAG TPA: ABC transporter ATP-binding protein [Candidatus Dormibacteraeota bacterium]|jgi:ATP-binding cassette subfamily B protein|nr:ABC transporter ATP-binding protein [Candidatus Dormibacteraeota bacterium]
MLIQLIRTYIRPYRIQVAIVAVLTLIQSLANLYLPNINADIINNGVVKGNVHYIWTEGGLMLGITVVLGIVAIIAVYWASMTAMGVGRDLRSDVFKRVQEFSAREVNHFGTPSLITRNTNDVQQIQLFMQIALTILASAPIMCVGGIILALREDVSLSALLLVVIPLMAAVIALMLVRAVPLFRSMQGKIDRINQVMREQITGVRVIRAFVRVGSERDRFETANLDLTNTALRVNRIFVIAFPTLLAVMNLSSVAILWFGGHLVASGQMPIGNLTAYLSYIVLILGSVMMAIMMVILVPRAEASAARIDEVVKTVPSISDPAEAVEPLHRTGIVEFHDVSFGYPGGEKPVLSDLTFDLRPGRTAAIIGGTGSGKTTLVNLIPRFLDTTSGSIRVDGVDVRDQTMERLWDQIGLVPQRAYLFRGTVADNLRLGRDDATDAELWHALEVAQARDFVATMPGQLDAPIDQGGTNVSGGQRQRLAIARALVKRPAVYLFDDCFSALDAATDARLRSALRADTTHSTVVIVAQRVSTIQHADQIIVLDEGRIVGLGNHGELLKSCEEYREIVASQLGEEAAA